MKRLDRLDIATSDLEDAASTYRRSFGFEVREASDGNSATIAIGDAEIQLKSVAPGVAEGMAALWLEAEDIDQVVAALKQAGIASAPPRREDGRRILAIDPKFANQVPLFIFDRKL
jgi:catechol 2,3-dioxygenase-like lactoylglutathione lyase family enzyme